MTDKNTVPTKNIELLRFLTCGSVDDGKSTLIGRLLYDSKSILEDQLDGIRSHDDGEINLANLTDGLRAEREQGITIDVAYRYFSTRKRRFIIADTPGHVQYTRNMVTGASTANLALLIIDARHGVTEQTRRHAFIACLLRIPHLAVCVNKMDLVDYSEEVFENIKSEFSAFATHLWTRDLRFIPISALDGDNVVEPSKHMDWYTGGSLLGYLENLHIANDRNLSDPRFPIQYVVRPHSDEFHDFRGYAGQIEGGVFRVGDKVKVLPTGMNSTIKSIYTYDGYLEEAFAPMSVTIELEDDIDISRGDTLVHADNIPEIGQELHAQLCWMSDEPLQLNRKYLLKNSTKTVRCMPTSIEAKVNISTLQEEEASELKLNDIGRVSIKTMSPLVYDRYRKNRYTGGLILIDEVTNNTVAAGLFLEPKKVAPKPTFTDYAI